MINIFVILAGGLDLEQPDYCENFDLVNIHTPILVDELIRLLNQYGYDKKKTAFLEEGFRHGFDIGYEGPEVRQSTSANIPLTVGNKVDLWNKLIKEVCHARVAGPFEQIPYQNYMQSPIGLVPKAQDQTRLIFHLSYPFDKGDGLGSLNEHTPKEKCKVKYRDLDYTIHAYLKLAGIAPANEEGMTKTEKRSPIWKRGNKTVIVGKTDIKSAFRLIPLLRRCWKWLIMKVQDPTSGEWCFFIDKCLPFGASISCALFQEFSDAFCFLIECKTNSISSVTNYLDDFLFLALTLSHCNYLISIFMQLCEQIGVPLALEKTEWGMEIIVFLGILLNGNTLSLSIPLEKRDKVIQLLNLMVSERKATVKELQSLCGYLNFLCKAIFPGRPFMRRMYAKYGIIYKTWGSGKCENTFGKVETALKSHHHVHLDREFKSDCKVWLKFLDECGMANAVNRPMVDILAPALTSEVIKFCSDASGRADLGYGCILDQSWISGTWDHELMIHKPSIEYLELFALVLGLLTWEERLSNCCIIIFCDNISVVHMVNSMSSSCGNFMILIRLMILNGL